MRLDLHIDRLMIRGADPADARAAMARLSDHLAGLPDYLAGLPAGPAGDRRVQALRVDACAADPDALAHALAAALGDALVGRGGVRSLPSPARQAGGTAEAPSTTTGGKP